jgi:hypothetical protein
MSLDTRRARAERNIRSLFSMPFERVFSSQCASDDGPSVCPERPLRYS